MSGERDRGHSLDPSPLTLLQALLELLPAACLSVCGVQASLANRTDARTGCPKGRAVSDADGAASGSEERVKAIAPSRREALHGNAGWSGVSGADPGVPPASSPVVAN